MVIVQPAIVIRVDALDIMRVDGNLQFVVRVEIPAGLVVHQEDSLSVLKHQVDDTHQGRKVIRQQDSERMFDRQHAFDLPAVLLVYTQGVGEMGLIAKFIGFRQLPL